MTDIHFIWWRVRVLKVLTQGTTAWVIMGQSSKASTRRICLLALQSKWLSNPLISLQCHLKPPSCRAMHGQKKYPPNTPKKKKNSERFAKKRKCESEVISWRTFQMTGQSDEMAFQQGIIFWKQCVGCVSTVDGLKQLSGIRQNCLLAWQCCFGESEFFFQSCIFFYLFILATFGSVLVLPIIKRLQNWAKMLLK